MNDTAADRDTRRARFAEMIPKISSHAHTFARARARARCTCLRSGVSPARGLSNLTSALPSHLASVSFSLGPREQRMKADDGTRG